MTNENFLLLIPSFIKDQSLAKFLMSRSKRADFINIVNYPDGEVGCDISHLKFVCDNVKILLMRGERGINSSIMSFLVACDALRRKFPNIKMEAIVPYMFYSRQDRITNGCQSLGAKIFLDMLGSLGVNSVVSIDAHFNQIQGFFSGRLKNLSAATVFAEDLIHYSGGDVCVAPDLGSVKRVMEILKVANIKDLAIIVKERLAGGDVSNSMIIGDIKGKHCIIFDDIVDGGSTLCKAAESLKKEGASRVSAYITHAVLSSFGQCIEQSNFIDSVVFTNTLEAPKLKNSRTLDVSKIFLEWFNNEMSGNFI